MKTLHAALAHARDNRITRFLHPSVMRETLAEAIDGHPIDEAHDAHIDAAIDWLCAAQDATDCGGIARGYSLVWNPYFETRGWEPAYPETTGYIIPTLLAASARSERPELRARALRAAHWELDIQLASGAVRGGVIGQPESPAVFNTGQVLFGWLAAFEQTGAIEFACAARRAAAYLCESLSVDGLWHVDNSQFASARDTLYNARTAWALAEAGTRLDMPWITAAAARALLAVAWRQRANGWVPSCCLNDPAHPLLHTLAYTIQGLLEGGRVLEDERLIDHAARAASSIAERTPPSGKIPGRFDHEWNAAVTWSCLTGNAQMVCIWLRLFEITGARRWLEPVDPVIRFLKRTQRRHRRVAGIHGGIRGSSPIGGAYGSHEILSWATKFFVDALMRHERVLAGLPLATGAAALA